MGNLVGGLGVQHPEDAGALNRLLREWSQPEAATAQGVLGQHSKAQRDSWDVCAEAAVGLDNHCGSLSTQEIL